MTRSTTTKRVRLKPVDSFDLIRVLARSQHDPRKAVCELVQNSLDARARRIELTWFNERGQRALRILDDGEGVFPDLAREEALLKIARTIGHSHKRMLDPRQRRELMLLGQYGIGLLGFWSVGRTLEIRSRVGGGEIWGLKLTEDRPTAELHRANPRRLDDEGTFTQVTIRAIHEGAARQIRPGRLRAYLASELRGQLLRREVELTIHDRVARGRAPKHFRIEPIRFNGVRLEHLHRLQISGYDDAVLELYLLPPESEHTGRVLLACGGTTVLDDLATVDGDDAARAPWDSGRIEGVVDFADLTVAPGTRRGFQRDAAALAFLDTLQDVEGALQARIAEEDRRLAEQQHKDLARHIRRAFVSVAATLPEYDLFEVRSGGDAVPPSATEQGAGLEAVPPGGPGTHTATRDSSEIEQGELFPPGPLAAVRISPAACKLPPGASRKLRARAVDRDGRTPVGDIQWSWRLDGPGSLTSATNEVTYTAPAYSAELIAEAHARQGDVHASATADISVIEALAGQEKVSGIPEPQPVHAPLEGWRSRMRDHTWEFNTGHRDYAAACESEAKRLRYLIHLFSKELVLRNFGGPADILERMVEVLTYLGDQRGTVFSKQQRRKSSSV